MLTKFYIYPMGDSNSKSFTQIGEQGTDKTNLSFVLSMVSILKFMYKQTYFTFQQYTADEVKSLCRMGPWKAKVAM